MVTYASVPTFAERRTYPRALVLIVAGHAALIAAVMLAKMDLPQAFKPQVTKVELLPLPKDPPPAPPEPSSEPKSSPSVIDRPLVVIPVPALPQPRLDPQPTPFPDPQPLIGRSPDPTPVQPRIAPPAYTAPRFATPDAQLRPPYPRAKIASGEEAALRLSLSIDERGRITRVEPVGPADPAFLAAARRHLIAHWRYQPATDGGRAVAATTVITLQFRLD